MVHIRTEGVRHLKIQHPQGYQQKKPIANVGYYQGSRPFSGSELAVLLFAMAF